MLLPMIAACFAAMLVPNLLHGAPIYDSLRERLFDCSTPNSFGRYSNGRCTSRK